MRKCIIFAGGVISDYSFINIEKDDYIICADGGYIHALKLRIKPDCILGDFDTFDKSGLPEDCKVLTYSAIKDYTDTMLAAMHALENGFKHITIYGASGGRFDHTMANVQTLLYVHKKGGTGVMVDENNIISLQTEGKMQYKKREGYYFSLFSLSDSCNGITETGTFYTLKNATLTNDFPLGVSNKIVDDYAEVFLESGTLLVIFSKDTHKNK